MADVVSDVSDIIGIIGNAGLDAGEAAVIQAYPWLGLPIIEQIWEAVLGSFISAVLIAMEETSTRILIPFIDQGQADAANAAAAKLQKDLDDANASQTAIQGELDDLKKKYADLIHLRLPT